MASIYFFSKRKQESNKNLASFPKKNIKGIHEIQPKVDRKQ